jgi:hypothetical protein
MAATAEEPELVLWRLPRYTGRLDGGFVLGAKVGSWPGRAKARFNLVAVNRSSKKVERTKFWPELQRQVMADC